MSIIENGQTLYTGIADGVNETGQLILRTARGNEAISVGEVSVRLPQRLHLLVYLINRHGQYANQVRAASH